MVNNAGATAPVTSPRNSALSSEAGLKPTPQVIGFAVVSKHSISTTGVEIDSVCPSIVRDVWNLEKCVPDIMRQDLHARCTCLHRVFEPERGFSGEAMAEDTQSALGLDSNFNKCGARVGIRGRTATVFPVESKALSGLRLDPHFGPRVTKLYWAEDSQQSDQMQTYPDALGHVPGLVLFHKFKGMSTSKIRLTSGLKDAEQAKLGSRVLTIIVFKTLLPITTLSGKEFLTAWWQIVKCHHALWKIGVHHRDVSPNNQMVYSLCGRFIGALNDYDLSSLKRDGPSCLERTGTVPFMAIDLLMPEAIAGNVEHVYAYDAESFIWVLIWVCLRYENGKLLSKNRPLEEWLKSDAIRCRVNKNDFLLAGLPTICPSGSHGVSWEVVQKCSMGIHSLYTPLGYRRLDDQSAFELLLEDPMQGLL
ncbi:hypothetical protein CY34DRAFT_807451 [Suillus luteus UH-Slu-Lm8-n1]|uniref:Fungal-type protein kinase domain-containing protein n=1 Tax=Suillus luteus UH-Slu-Lm8-n1 TaxID=930992 RepID=A0A0C9ZR60_9AGAM|nr:hypothetical protein CY34DRAFT_807451 [Suillus luteus UH-Slu-Lm8-n1]